MSYLHCPLSVSQLTSGEMMPGREQLQISQPTTGWQPKVWGSHWVHSGRRVLGGQIQSPVTGSHNLEPQLQAGGKGRGNTVSYRNTILCCFRDRQEGGKGATGTIPLKKKKSFILSYCSHNTLVCFIILYCFDKKC